MKKNAPGNAPGMDTLEVLLECSWNAPGMLLGNRRYYWGSEIADSKGVYAISDTIGSPTFLKSNSRSNSLEFQEHSRCKNG